MSATTTRSARWKALERDAAQALGGRRIVEPWTLFRKRPDVVVEDFNIVLDAKAYQRHSLHRHLEKVEAEYCGAGDVPAVVTRERGGVAYVTVPLTFLGELLDSLRAAREGA